jgi:hypothetical protein
MVLMTGAGGRLTLILVLIRMVMITSTIPLFVIHHLAREGVAQVIVVNTSQGLAR